MLTASHDNDPVVLLTLYLLNLFRGNKYMYLHFMSFLHIDMMQVFEIFPQVRPGHTYSTSSQYHGC